MMGDGASAERTLRFLFYARYLNPLIFARVRASEPGKVLSMTKLRLLTLLGAVAASGITAAQVTLSGFSDTYRQEGVLRVAGWSVDERYFVFDTSQDQFGGADRETRYVV